MKNISENRSLEEICWKDCILQQCLAKDIKLSSFLGGNLIIFFLFFLFVCFSNLVFLAFDLKFDFYIS